MEFDIAELFNNDVFKSMAPEKRTLCYEFAEKLRCSSPAASIPLFARFSQKLERTGGRLSPEEKTAIIAALENIVPASEQGKFGSALKMLEKLF